MGRSWLRDSWRGVKAGDPERDPLEEFLGMDVLALVMRAGIVGQDGIPG